MTERSYVQTSTRANVRIGDRHVPEDFTNALEFLKAGSKAGRVGGTFMEHTIAGPLDGAPMMGRRHHLEKAVAVIGIDLMELAWR